MRRLIHILVLIPLLVASGAGADDMGDPEPLPAPVPQEPPATVEQETSEMVRYGTPAGPHVSPNGREAIDDWDDTRGYRYGTDYLFPFTRGMEDVGITGWARYPTALLTVPIDVALLPVGAIAGLWGG